MPPMNGNIRNYFRPLQHSSTNLAVISAENHVPMPSPCQLVKPVAPISAEEPAARPQATQLVIRSSDDEDRDSDSSLEDLTDLLQFRSTSQRSSARVNGFESSTNAPARSKRKHASIPISSPATKPKYRFDMKMLVNQAEIDEATDASALRVKALLDNAAVTTPASQNSSPGHAPNDILESVIAEQEGVTMEKVLQAVKRTEATHAQKRWYFFDPIKGASTAARLVPAKEATEEWQRNLADSRLREQLVLSNFVKDMVTLGNTLPDEVFLWMLDEICLESRDDLRQGYCNILVASTQQARQLIQPQTIMNLFLRLGGRETAIDVHQRVKLVSADPSRYEGQDWTVLRAAVAFIGQISKKLSAVTCSYIMCLLARLCVDNVVLENIGLLSAVQKTMEQTSRSISAMYWERSCREICSSIFTTVEQASLRFQVLRCIPAATSRVHQLRRQLALAFFFEDIGYSTSAPHYVIDLWEITKRLDEPQFKVKKDTDYYQLAALMSILDVAIDNGQSVENDLSNSEGERDFDTDIDTLDARIKVIWSSINDAGASFISRIDAKEVMESMRQRLIYAVRTKPKPKQSIFDAEPDGSESERKQADMMDRIFRRGILHER